VPREQLAKMMEFEADRMTGLILKTKTCCPSATSCSKNSTCGPNNPEARLTEQIMAALYLNHPYADP